MIEFIFSLYAYLILCFVIGYFPARYLWPHAIDHKTELAHSQSVLIFSFPIGFFLFNLAVFLFCRIQEAGVARIAPYTLAGLLLTVGLFFLLRRQALVPLFQLLHTQTRFLLFLLALVLPLSALHLLWPMLLHGWQAGYAIGTDGAAYIYLGEYLQQHYWGPGSAPGIVPFGYIGRPLASYLPADALALFPITMYQAHSLIAALISFFLALTLGWLAQQSFALQDSRRPLILAAIVMGIFAFQAQIYWDRSFMSQFFSLLPFLLTPVYFFLPTRIVIRFAFLFFLFLIATTVYSIGLSLIQFFLISFGLAILWILRHIQFKRLTSEGITAFAALACANGLLYKTEAPFFLGNLERGYAPILKTLQNITIKFGLFAVPIPAEDKFFQLAILLIIFLIVYAFIRAFHNAKQHPGYLAMLLGTGGILLVAALLNKYFFLNKVIVYFIALLFIPLLADIKPIKGLKWKLGSLLLAGVFSAFVLSGFYILDRYYYTIANQRSSYISRGMIEVRDNLVMKYHPKTIFAIDNLLERHQLTRILFHDVGWRQGTTLDVWQEFGINPKNPPPSFKNYDFDLLLIGKSDYDPVDYSADKPWWVGELPGHDIYRRGASIVDFDLSWDLVTGRPKDSVYFRRSREPGAEIVFVNDGAHRWLEIDFQLEKDGTTLNLAAAPENLFTLDNHPLRTVSAHTVRTTCPDLCQQRINHIKLNSPPGMGVIVSGVRFGS